MAKNPAMGLTRTDPIIGSRRNGRRDCRRQVSVPVSATLLVEVAIGRTRFPVVSLNAEQTGGLGQGDAKVIVHRPPLTAPTVIRPALSLPPIEGEVAAIARARTDGRGCSCHDLMPEHAERCRAARRNRHDPEIAAVELQRQKFVID